MKILIGLLCAILIGCGGGDEVSSALVPPKLDGNGRVIVTADDLIAAVNGARAVSRYCGPTLYPAAPPVALNSRLSESARVHGTAMTENNYFGFSGPPDYTTPEQRILAAGYPLGTCGEAIFGTNTTNFPLATAVVESMLGSLTNCRVLMNPALPDCGAADVVDLKRDLRYVVFDLAAPK